MPAIALMFSWLVFPRTKIRSPLFNRYLGPKWILMSSMFQQFEKALRIFFCIFSSLIIRKPVGEEVKAVNFTNIDVFITCIWTGRKNKKTNFQAVILHPAKRSICVTLLKCCNKQGMAKSVNYLDYTFIPSRNTRKYLIRERKLKIHPSRNTGNSLPSKQW